MDLVDLICNGDMNLLWLRKYYTIYDLMLLFRLREMD
jgi:hypothetical protein